MDHSGLSPAVFLCGSPLPLTETGYNDLSREWRTSYRHNHEF